MHLSDSTLILHSTLRGALGFRDAERAEAAGDAAREQVASLEIQSDVYRCIAPSTRRLDTRPMRRRGMVKQVRRLHSR